MLKRRHNRFLVAGFAAAALAFGSLAPTTAPAVASTHVEATMNSVYADEFMSVLEIVAGPEHVGEPVVILEGWAPGMGTPVASFALGYGPNYVAVPAAFGMVRTAMSPSFLVASGNVDFPPEGD